MALVMPRMWAELVAVEAASASELADYLWFEVTKLRADAAYGAARVHTLEALQRRSALGEVPR